MTSKALRNNVVPAPSTNRLSALVRFATASALISGAVLGLTGCGNNTLANTAIKPSALTSNGKHRTLILVWDGMRPDSIDATLTPTLYGLVKAGSYFSDNHSTYPTYTMANGAAFATGGFIGTTGFNGNNTYAGPSTGLVSASGNSSAGVKVDFTQPQFTEDWGILDDLNAYYEKNYQQTLLTVGTLFQAAQTAGLHTAAVGKSGPAYLQDFLRGGIIADENVVFPLSFAKELQNQQVILPSNTVFGYPTGTITLSATNGTPTVAGAKVNLADGATPDPTSTAGSRQASANAYLTSVFAGPILQNHTPDLAVFWLRKPRRHRARLRPGYRQPQCRPQGAGRCSCPDRLQPQGARHLPDDQHHRRLRPRTQLGPRARRRSSRCAPSWRARRPASTRSARPAPAAFRSPATCAAPTCSPSRASTHMTATPACTSPC